MECGVATFTDPDEYGGSVPGVGINLVLTEPGEFRGRVTWVKLPRLSLFRCSENMSHVAFVSMTKGPVFISFPTRSSPSPVWQGVEMQRGEMVVHGGASLLCLRAAGNCRWGSIAVESNVLRDYSAAIGRQTIRSQASARILRPPREAASSMLLLHEQACRLAETKPASIAHREVARALEQDLLYALTKCLAGDEAHRDTGARQRHADIMARLEQTMARHETTPLTAAQLAAAVGAPERTLQACCAEFLGMSPGEYSRLRRLHLLRKALRRADPGAATVSAVAGHYGFRELGRLAGAYRKAFGESPSETLNDFSKKFRPSAEFA
jgi:AraC-like DNA-binding protein